MLGNLMDGCSAALRNARWDFNPGANSADAQWFGYGFISDFHRHPGRVNAYLLQVLDDIDSDARAKGRHQELRRRHPPICAAFLLGLIYQYLMASCFGCKAQVSLIFDFNRFFSYLDVAS